MVTFEHYSSRQLALVGVVYKDITYAAIDSSSSNTLF